MFYPKTNEQSTSSTESETQTPFQRCPSDENLDRMARNQERLEELAQRQLEESQRQREAQERTNELLTTDLRLKIQQLEQQKAAAARQAKAQQEFDELPWIQKYGPAITTMLVRNIIQIMISDVCQRAGLQTNRTIFRITDETIENIFQQATGRDYQGPLPGESLGYTPKEQEVKVRHDHNHFHFRMNAPTDRTDSNSGSHVEELNESDSSSSSTEQRNS